MYVRAGECNRCYYEAFRQKNRDKLRAYAKQYRAIHADKARAARRKHYVENREKGCEANKSWYHRSGFWLRREQRYGITRDKWLAMYEAQGGKCRICADAITVSRAATDHDHQTGKVRGLLCSRCNSMLGHSRDRKDILESAIRYLGEAR